MKTRSWPSHGLSGALLAVLLLSLGGAGPVHARQGEEPRSWNGKSAPVENVPVLVLPPVDVSYEKSRDEQDKRGGPLRFAVERKVSVDPHDIGAWEKVNGEGWIWRYRIHVPGATDLNLGFGRYRLPAGATLHIISESRRYYEGPYTDRDNKPGGELWTPVVPGGRIILELFVPGEDRSAAELKLNHVGAGYRDLFKNPDLSKQGSCNIDVVCPEGDAWRNQIRSVARYTRSGRYLCTGTLVMDAASSFRNYFLTADHCGISTSNDHTVVVYWNFESATCGDLGGGSLADNQTGSILRASRADVDMTLIELDNNPDASFNVFYSGWDRSGSVPSGSVGIHHPDGAVKAISINTDRLSTGNSCIGSGGVNSHWYVDNWEDGTTEPGSSGSGIWDPSSKRLVGFLSGGAASCSNISYDCYGKFSEAWNGTGSGQRLKDWLDPGGTGAQSVAGKDPGSGGGGTPGPVTPLSPQGDITDDTPTYTWEAGSNSNRYKLRVDDSTGDKRVLTWYTDEEAGCSGGGTCSIAPAYQVAEGDASWKVRGGNDTDTGEWSDPLAFNVTGSGGGGGGTPGQVTLVSPQGDISDDTPTYTWNADPLAGDYKLWVNDSTGSRIRRWYPASDAGCGSGTGTCSLTPTDRLASGSAEWKILTRNSEGKGPWSDKFAFTVTGGGGGTPGQVTLVSPQGNISDDTPTYTWNADPLAEDYKLWVNDSNGKRIRRWYSASDANCGSGTGTCSVTPSDKLANGNGEWKILTRNGDGKGPWSDKYSFKVQ